MHGVQAAQLQHDEEQEEFTRQIRDEQILQILQKAYSSQRKQVNVRSLSNQLMKGWVLNGR